MPPAQGGCWLLLSDTEGQKSRKDKCRITGLAAVSGEMPQVGRETVLNNTIVDGLEVLG